MPDFFVHIVDGNPQMILVVSDGILFGNPSTKRRSITLADGRQFDWRNFRDGARSQEDMAELGFFWGFRDTVDHSTETPAGDFFLEAQATTPITYIRKRPWVPGPTELERPMPVEKILAFIETLPDHGGIAWINDWETVRNSNGARRRILDAFERGDTPFFFASFIRFATIVLGAAPSPAQITVAQNRWATAINMPVGSTVFDPTEAEPPVWSAVFWRAGSHVIHNGTTYRATFSYALPAQVPGIALVWDVVP